MAGHIPGDPPKGPPLGMAITSHIIEQAAPNLNTNKFNLSEKEMCKQNNVLSFLCLSKSWIQKMYYLPLKDKRLSFGAFCLFSSVFSPDIL